MSTIPTSAFADRLQTLTHEEFQTFVADLWSLAGWETSLDGDIVVTRKGNRERRLLVLPGSRLARLRSETPSADQVDRVISPRVESAESTQLDGVGIQLVDAHDLRHRLIYSCETDVSNQLWATYFDDELRGPEWEDSERNWTMTQLALAGVSLLLIAGAIAVLTFGLPFFESDEPSAQATATTLDGGLDATIDVGPPDQSIALPSAIAWGPTVYAGTETGTFAALDGETGDTVWTQELGSHIRSPIVSNGTVYVRSSQGVHALDAVTGEIQWEYNGTSNDWTHFAIFRGSSARLTVVDDTVYFGDGEELVTLDAQTGDTQWRVPISTAVTGAPTVFNGTVYAGGLNSFLSAHSVTDGNETWKADEIGQTFQTSGVPHGGEKGSLLVPGGATLYEFDTETGEQGWTFESRSSGDILAPMALDGSDPLGTDRNTTRESEQETVYVADNRAFLYAIDRDTGERIWTYQKTAMGFESAVLGGPAGNDTVHTAYLVGNSPLGETASMLTAINASSADERWRYENQNESIQAPTVFDETLYAGTDGGEVMALETVNGTERWRVDAFENGINGAATVVTEPLGGDSVDSRVRLGVGGHHDWLTDREESAPATTAGPSVIETHLPEKVAAGEQVDGRVSLANTNDSQEHVSVVLEPDWDSGAEDVLEAEVELAPGEAREITFSFPAPDDPGNYSSQLRVGEERTDHTTTVTERPAHEVTGLDDSGSVWQNEQTEIIASVRNTGDIDATAPVALEFDGEIVDSTQQRIEANETESVTFTLDAEGAHAGEYNYTVATNDDLQSAPIEVLAVDRREDAIPIVTQVFGVTLLLSGLALGWRVVTDVHGPVLRGGDAAIEQ